MILSFSIQIIYLYTVYYYRQGLAYGNDIRVSIWPSLCHMNNDLHILYVPEDHVVLKIASNRFKHLCSINTNKMNNIDGLVRQEKIKLTLSLINEQFGIEYHDDLRSMLSILYGVLSNVPLVTSLVMDILEQPIV